MKKQIISIAIAITLGTPSQTMAFLGAGAADLERSVPPLSNWFSWGTPPKKTPPKKPSPPQHYVELISLVKKQLEQTEKIHKSITENRNFGTKKLGAVQTDHSSFFLKNPQLVYNKSTHPTISASLTNILQEEEIPTSVRESRDSIDKRLQHAAAVDKAVSLQTFQETENRFKQISELVKQINTTADLKGIAELQARIKGMLAMIQNEATKLQMVAHSRNAEQALINQQKQKRNMRILSSKNKEMPPIRSIR
ncbi:type IV secretion system protein [Bartonella sp. B12(2025)]